MPSFREALVQRPVGLIKSGRKHKLFKGNYLESGR